MRPEFREANERFAARFEQGHLEAPPARSVAILTCMDARILPDRILGLDVGDAHVVRNAGGRATEDALRSLLISTWVLGTREVVVIHHTDCGLEGTDDEALGALIRERSGHDLGGMAFHGFEDLDASVLEDVEALRSAPGLPNELRVSGHVYDVRTGRLREVAPPS